MAAYWRRFTFFFCFFLSATPWLWAAAGREGASFLDIPVGAEPAALGSAYTALATNAYATAWNPAGLALVDVPEISGMHLSYLASINYEHLSAAIPWHEGDVGRGFGASIQSLGSGSMDQRDDTGTKIGSFSSSFASYSLGYGQTISEESSVGIMVKAIREKISDVSASAYAADFGWLYLPRADLTLGVAASNIGTALKLVDQSDPLPVQARVGAAWRPSTDFQLSDDVIYRRHGPLANAFGVEWSNSTYFALRAGYNTSHTKELSVASGFSAGAAIRYWGQEFAYAWVPFGDLGNTHYFSLLIRFSTQPRPDRAYPDLPKVRLRRANDEEGDTGSFDSADKVHAHAAEPPASGYHDYGNVYDILSDEEKKSLKKQNYKAPKSEEFKEDDDQ